MEEASSLPTNDAVPTKNQRSQCFICFPFTGWKCDLKQARASSDPAPFMVKSYLAFRLWRAHPRLGQNNLDAGLFAYAVFINSLYQRDPHQCHHHTEGQGANHHSHSDCLYPPIINNAPTTKPKAEPQKIICGRPLGPSSPPELIMSMIKTAESAEVTE